MACAKCPYQFTAFEVLWQDDAESGLTAVMLRCCAGPELQIRRGRDVLLSELFPTAADVMARAEELRDGFDGPEGRSEPAQRV